MFNKEVYVRRRQTLLDKMRNQGATGVVLFIGNIDAPAQYRDNCYKFRQESCWLYYFGIDEARYAALLDLESGSETIYADDVDIDDIIWMGPMPSVASVAAGTGVACTAPYSRLDEDVASARAAGRQVHFLPSTRYSTALKLGSLLGIRPEDTFKSGKAGCAKASSAFVQAVVEMRLVKEDVEIEELEKACTLGQMMHTVARRGIAPGVLEQTIVGDMEGFTLGNGWGVSFPTILTQHGEIFHCHSHENLIEPGKLLVIDAGLETNAHYASDFTRTYPTAGKFTQKQRDIYQIVYECNEYAFSITRPGISYLDVHLNVARKMLEGLKALDLVRGDVDEMVPLGIAGLFMPHGLGHNMGLDVHDMEDLGENIVGYGPGQTRSKQLGLGSLRMARVLVPGNLVTDEPGIYFIPALIEQWKKEGTDKGFVNYARLEEYYDFGGIRLEDDVLLTADGARRLGANRLPIAPDDVEAAMAADKE